MKLSISIKTKALIFVLGVIIVFFSIISYQNKVSQENFIKEVERSYIKSFENYFASFTTGLIKYYTIPATYFSTYEVIKKIEEKDFQELLEITRFTYDNMKESNYYLHNVSFIFADAKYLVNKNEISFESSIEKEYNPLINLISNRKRNLIDIVHKNNEVYIRFLKGVFFNNKLLGIVEFLIDANAIIESKNNFDGSLGFIYLKRFKEIYRKYQYSNNDNMNIFRSINQKDLNENDILEIDNKFYIAKIFPLKNILGEDVAKTIFFLDITDKKVPYESILLESFIYSIVLLIIIGVILNYVFSYLITRLELSENQYKNLNTQLEQRVNDEIETKMLAIKEKEEKEKMLISQSKLASLGEMIANIAHQWKQPLTQMSTIMMVLEAYQENNKLTNKKLSEKIDESNELIEYMAHTIDDFKNFFKPDKQKEKFFVEESISNTLSIVTSSLSFHSIDIKVIERNKEIEVYGYKNEFSQVLLNIISNAKDVLLERNIPSPYIEIIVYKNKNENIIEISDNAGGIEDKILDKIFDPYFTTKHSSQGTGIGLYMSKMIIEKNMQGFILVSNNELGACFTIKL